MGKIEGVEFFVFGTGDPVTVFAHGFGGLLPVSETKPLAMPLKGTRVLFNFRGHGGSDALADGWDYDLLDDKCASRRRPRRRHRSVRPITRRRSHPAAPDADPASLLSG